MFRYLLSALASYKPYPRKLGSQTESHQIKRTLQSRRRRQLVLETLEMRHLLTSVSGVVFNDENGDGVRQVDEAPMSGVDVDLISAQASAVVSEGGLFDAIVNLAVDADGSLVVVNRNRFGPPVIRIDPTTGAQEAASRNYTGDHFTYPGDVAIASDGTLYVVERTQNKVVAVDPNTLEQRVVSEAGEMELPTAIALESPGKLLVADSVARKLIRIDINNGEQQVVSELGLLRKQGAIQIAPDGKIIVLGHYDGRVVEVNPQTGAQRLLFGVPHGFERAVDMVLTEEGDVLILDQNLRTVTRRSAANPAGEIVFDNGDLVMPAGLAAAPEGGWFLLDTEALGGQGAVFRVDLREAVAQAVTNAAGEFQFNNPPVAAYEIFVAAPDGTVPTGAHPQRVDLAEQADVSLELGWFNTVTVSGVKFNDLNENGVQDAGESGQPGWVIYIDENLNGVPDPLEPSSITDALGAFAFSGVGPGQYTLRARNQVGWTDTYEPIVLAVDSSNDITGVQMGSRFGEEMGETGVITNLDHHEQTVMLRRSYVNPVVIAQSPSTNGGDQALARITGVQSDRFSIVLHEPPGRDGRHKHETVSYLVMEAGVWQFADGRTIEVGSIETSANVGPLLSDNWATLSFDGGFSDTPVVFSVSSGAYWPSR